MPNAKMPLDVQDRLQQGYLFFQCKDTPHTSAFVTFDGLACMLLHGSIIRPRMRLEGFSKPIIHTPDGCVLIALVKPIYFLRYIEVDLPQRYVASISVCPLECIAK